MRKLAPSDATPSQYHRHATPELTQDALCPEIALLPACNRMAKLDLVADLLKPSPLVRAALLLALLLGQLFTLRARQLLARFLPALGAIIGTGLVVARASLRGVVVREITRLEGEEESVRERFN